MARLVSMFGLFFTILCLAEAVTLNNMYQTVQSVGQEVREEWTSKLKNAIKETLERSTSLQQKRCVWSQISSGYRDLNRDLGSEQGTLKREFAVLPPSELESLTEEELSKKIDQRLRAAVASFGSRIQTINQCA